MAIAKERASVISAFLGSNPERATRLLGLKPDIAVQQINDFGYNFTIEELKSYAEATRDVAMFKDVILSSMIGGMGKVVNTDIILPWFQPSFSPVRPMPLPNWQDVRQAEW